MGISENQQQQTSSFLRVFGFISCYFYVLPWVTLTLFFPFLFGWKEYILSGAMDLLKHTYRIKEEDETVTLLELACGIFTALFTFAFLTLNQRLLNKKAPFLTWLLLIILALSSPGFLWLAKEDFENRQKHFWLFGAFIGLSGLGEAAFSSFSDGAIEFFYKNDHRYWRLFLSQVAEGVGIAYGLYCGRQTESVRKRDQKKYSENVFVILIELFLFAAILLAITIGHNLFARFSLKFNGYPDAVKKCCLADKKKKTGDDGDDMMDDVGTSDLNLCSNCRPLQDENDDQEENDVKIKPTSHSARMWLFHSLTTCEAFSMFVRNAFFWWGLRHLEEVAPLEWTKYHYAYQIAIGYFLGALFATIFLKMYIDSKKVMRIDGVVGLVLGVSLAISGVCLALSLVWPYDFNKATDRLALSWPLIVGYVTTMTMSHIVIDEVQFRLIAPKLRGIGFSSELVVQEIGKAAGPLFIEKILQQNVGLKLAMIYLLIPSLITGIIIFIPLTVVALYCKKTSRQITNIELSAIEKITT